MCAYRVGGLTGDGRLYAISWASDSSIKNMAGLPQLNLNPAELAPQVPQLDDVPDETSGEAVMRLLKSTILSQLLRGSTADSMCAAIQRLCATSRDACQAVEPNVWTRAIAVFGPRNDGQRFQVKQSLGLGEGTSDFQLFTAMCNALAAWFKRMPRTPEVEWQIQMMFLPGHVAVPPDPNQRPFLHALACYYQDMIYLDDFNIPQNHPPPNEQDPLPNPPPRMPDTLRFLATIVHFAGGRAFKAPVWAQHPRFNFFDFAIFIRSNLPAEGMDYVTNGLRQNAARYFTDSEQERQNLSHRMLRGGMRILLDSIVASLVNIEAMPLRIRQYDNRAAARILLRYPEPRAPTVYNSLEQFTERLDAMSLT